jgi:hypothetical protein
MINRHNTPVGLNTVSHIEDRASGSSNSIKAGEATKSSGNPANNMWQKFMLFQSVLIVLLMVMIIVNMVQISKVNDEMVDKKDYNRNIAENQLKLDRMWDNLISRDSRIDQYFNLARDLDDHLDHLQIQFNGMKTTFDSIVGSDFTSIMELTDNIQVNIQQNRDEIDESFDQLMDKVNQNKDLIDSLVNSTMITNANSINLFNQIFVLLTGQNDLMMGLYNRIQTIKGVHVTGEIMTLTLTKMMIINDILVPISFDYKLDQDQIYLHDPIPGDYYRFDVCSTLYLDLDEYYVFDNPPEVLIGEDGFLILSDLDHCSDWNDRIYTYHDYKIVNEDDLCKLRYFLPETDGYTIIIKHNLELCDIT